MKIDFTTYRSSAYGSRVRLLVFHSMNIDFQRGMRILSRELSAHYVVADARFAAAGNEGVKDAGGNSGGGDGEPARVFQLVSEHDRAWHAGVGAWQCQADVNDRSIGVEVCGYFDKRDDPLGVKSPMPSPRFTAAECDAVVSLARGILARYPDIKPLQVIGHSDCAVGRKLDPGRFFPWQALHEHGIGAWPAAGDVAKASAQIQRTRPGMAEIQRQLRALGYIGVHDDGEFGEYTAAAIRAFQLHWNPDMVTGEPDANTLARLQALLLRYT